MGFVRRKAPLLVLQTESDIPYDKVSHDSSSMTDTVHYTAAQEAEVVLKMLSTIPPEKLGEKIHPTDRVSGRRFKGDRVAHLLDSLATICVSKPLQEPVAVGLQMHATEKKLTFVLAVEKIMEEKTVSHLRNVLRGLQEVGHAFSKYRVSLSATEKVTSDDFEHDDLPPKLQDMERRWFATMYRFSFTKFKRSFQKPFKNSKGKNVPRIDHFIKVMDAIPEPHGRNRLMLHFREVLSAMKVVKKILDTPVDYIDDQTLDRLDEALYYAACRVKVIFRRKSWEAILEGQLERYSSGTENFPFEKFLKKLSIMPKACRSLLYVADTPSRYQQYLKSATIDVISLRTPKQRIHLPPPNAASTIHHTLLTRTGLHNHPLYKTSSPTNSKLKFWDSRRKTRMHAECAIAMHLLREHSRAKSPVPAYSYIGLSKPGCVACREFLASIRDHASVLFTRESSGKACFPWKFPGKELEEAGLSSAMKRDIAEVFVDRVSAEFFFRARNFVRGDDSKAKRVKKRSFRRRLLSEIFWSAVS